MKYREKIRENYEDAMFFMLMDRLAEEQGKEYKKINDELRDSPEFVVPEEIRKECYRTINKEFARIRRKNSRMVVKKVFQRVSILIAILFLMITTALALSAELRTKALNWAIEVMDDHTNITFDSKQGENIDIKIEWIPTGYECINISEDKTFWQFQNSQEEWIILTAVEGNGSEVNLDTEAAAVIEKLNVLDYEGIYIEKEENTTLFWVNKDTVYAFTLFANKLVKEDMIRIAENVFIN